MHFHAEHRIMRLVVAGALTGALIFGGLVGATNVAAAEVITPYQDAVTITTSGWGHGRGMSQYGANEAAKQGLKVSEILAFYYPETKLASLSESDVMRVWIKADNDGDLQVKPATGLTITDSMATKILPTGTGYTKWRITRPSDTTQKLSYLDAKGAWIEYDSTLNTKNDWTFFNTSSGLVQVVLPSQTIAYRGSVGMPVQGGQKITVNTLPTEEYLRSVVPAEMPASWKAEALKAQAIAARTYAARYRANLGGKKTYDICDTTSCQVYKGTASGHANSDAAISATAGQVLTYAGKYAWTEFTSSNGGYSRVGDEAYLIAQEDAYDLAAKQLKTVTVTSATLNSKYGIGALKSISLKRDGKGLWGGRVTSVTLTGSKTSKTVTGGTFKSDLGLRETLFLVVGSPEIPLAERIAITSASVKDATWSGKALKPAVTVRVDGKTLKLNTDYTVAYKSNTNIGTGTLTVTGKGKYQGTTTATFKIAPKNTKVKSATAGKKKVTVKWNKVSAKQKITGYQILYRVLGQADWKTKTVSAAKSSLVIKGLKKKSKYQVRIRAYKTISGVKYLSAQSATKTTKAVK